MISLHETCQEYFRRRLREGWKCISLEGHNAVLLSPDGIRREIDLRNDVETLRPNAAGVEENIETVVGDGVGSHYSAVNVVDDTSYVENTTQDYQRDLYNVDDHSVGIGTINSITIYFRIKSNYAGAWAKPALRSDTTITDGTQVVVDYSWTTHSEQWNTNPADAGAWAWADIDALQIGVSVKMGVGGWSRCSQVYVEVDYTPPAVGLENKSANMGSKMVAAGLI